jgi:lipopolysaccharide heptosyltransferase I
VSDDLKNILIIKPSSLGDIVLALPALSALRRNFPDAEISWVVRPEFALLIENHPHLNRTILFDRRFLGKAWYHPRALAGLFALIRKLRKAKYDAVIDLQGLFRTAVFGWLSGCKKRFGMATAREFASLFYTDKIAQDADSIHVVDYYLKIIRQTGAEDTSIEFVLPVDSAAKQSIKKLLAEHNVAFDKYAVFVPSSVHADKCWSLERFATLADKISSQFGLSIVTTGTIAEKPIIERLKKLANVQIVNLAGLTNIRELVALLSTARLVVSNDTGSGHVAAALNRPLVMIFGRSNPARVQPYGRVNCVAAVEPEKRGTQYNSTDPKHNIKAVSFEQVYEKACEQIEQADRQNG